MLFTAIFTIILAIFGTIATIVIPVMPHAFESVLTTIFQYIDTGLKYVWIFVPRNLVLQLFQWWISLCALLLTWELIIEIWRLITGNVGGQEATAETITYDAEGNMVGRTVRQRKSSWKSILPRLRR